VYQAQDEFSVEIEYETNSCERRRMQKEEIEGEDEDHIEENYHYVEGAD